jgi:hypothetical protein
MTEETDRRKKEKKLTRTNVVLGDERVEWLKKEAESRGLSSVSELLRQLVDKEKERRDAAPG